MAHVNDLDPQVLFRILCLASGGPAKHIYEWKRKLTLLQVCTKWYDLLKSYVFSQGFVRIHSLHDSTDLDSTTSGSCIYFYDNDIVCRSNLGIITGRDKHNCDCVSELDVGVFGDLHVSKYGHILENLLALGVGYWFNLSSLVLDSRPNFGVTSTFQMPNLDELSGTVSKYISNFYNQAPNITRLVFDYCEDKVLTSTFSILIYNYAQHLQHLYIYYPINSPLPVFSPELTSLSLALEDYTHRHFSFYAKSLQYLNFDNISSSNFSWWAFHDFETPGYIEFTHLKTLSLSYKAQTEKEQKLSEKYSKQTRPYGTHMLRFPKLQNLTLLYPPVDCDVFYTDTISSQLEKLNIQGDCDSVVAASRLRFTSVNEMLIKIYGEEEPKTDFYVAAGRYFGYTKIRGSCIASFDSMIDIKRTGSWVNVTQLGLHRIGFDELLQHIPNFYNLRDLSVGSIYLSDESLSIIQFGLEEEKQETFELLDTKIEFISIGNTEPDGLYNYLAILNHLLIRTATLKKINIDYSQIRIVEKSFLPGKFSHVRFS